MTTSELITPHHLTRKAIIYIRQSRPHQVLTNQESLRLQYALLERAVELGWRAEEIEIIDGDLGLSGAATHYREGFKELLTRVTVGEVGIIFSVEVQRLSRNCSDWYPLLDICGFKHCLIADRDGVYDPGTPNGRLLIGLKGQLSEIELYTIRARMTAGLLNKAQRGELALSLPVGLVRDVEAWCAKSRIWKCNSGWSWSLLPSYNSGQRVKCCSSSMPMTYDCRGTIALATSGGANRPSPPSWRCSRIRPMPERLSTGAVRLRPSSVPGRDDACSARWRTGRPCIMRPIPRI